MLDIESISSNLELSDDGIWVARSQRDVSYPRAADLCSPRHPRPTGFPKVGLTDHHRTGTLGWIVDDAPDRQSDARFRVPQNLRGQTNPCWQQLSCGCQKVGMSPGEVSIGVPDNTTDGDLRRHSAGNPYLRRVGRTCHAARDTRSGCLALGQFHERGFHVHRLRLEHAESGAVVDEGLMEIFDRHHVFA